MYEPWPSERKTIQVPSVALNDIEYFCVNNDLTANVILNRFFQAYWNMFRAKQMQQMKGMTVRKIYLYPRKKAKI